MWTHTTKRILRIYVTLGQHILGRIGNVMMWLTIPVMMMVQAQATATTARLHIVPHRMPHRDVFLYTLFGVCVQLAVACIRDDRYAGEISVCMSLLYTCGQASCGSVANPGSFQHTKTYVACRGTQRGKHTLHAEAWLSVCDESDARRVSASVCTSVHKHTYVPMLHRYVHSIHSALVTSENICISGAYWPIKHRSRYHRLCFYVHDCCSDFTTFLHTHTPSLLRNTLA